MSVLIRGMEMPDYGYVCLKVFANGEVLMTKVHRGALVITGLNDKVGTAVPIPPHGRLIDADELFKEMERNGWYNNADRDIAEDLVLAAPTIIPADKEGE